MPVRWLAVRARPLRRIRRFRGWIRKIVLHPPLHRTERARKSPAIPGSFAAAKWLIHKEFSLWRRDPESNRARRICNPLHNRFAIAPGIRMRRDRLDALAAHQPYPLTKTGSLGFPFRILEREKSLELSTSTLARLRSTN